MRVILNYRLKGTKEVQTLVLFPEDARDSFFLRSFIREETDWHEWRNDLPTEVVIKQSQAVPFTPGGSKPMPATPKPLARRIEDAFNMPLVCARSGIPLGKFVPSPGLATATPYVQAWKQSTFLHPIFSLGFPELVHRANACWQLEKSGARQFPAIHKQLLFLAMLHASGLIKQDSPGLPSIKTVEAHFPHLLELLGWKYETASDRVAFPKLHVNKSRDEEGNIFRNVGGWLEVCDAVKEEYENVSRTRQKAARAKAKEMAMKSIKRAMYADISLKRLWNWIASQVPQNILENNPDLEMLFFAEEAKINIWTAEDIEALEDLWLKHCETGNSVSFEVGKRINQLKDQLNVYNDTFELVDVSEQFKEHKGLTEPRPESFANRAAYLVAKAKWQLANKDQGKGSGDDL
jgi:hypothetical protein